MTRRTAVGKKQGGTTKKAPSMKIKKGDHVVVLAGKDSGREGTVHRSSTPSGSGSWSRAST